MFGPELSGVVDSGAALALLEPLRSRLYTDAGGDRLVGEELRRHSQDGEWEAVGAWKFASNFVSDPAIEAELTDSGLLAVARMRVTNLSIHLGGDDLRRFEELTGGPAPFDGFFGPPTFDTPLGPSRRFFLDEALAAASARDPQRVRSRAGVAPEHLQDLPRSLWDFGMLVLRGPLLVAPELRFEPATVRPVVAAATDVDHLLFAEAVRAGLAEEDAGIFNGWSYAGAGRFIEDYLDPALTAGDVHAQLVDAGLRQLLARGMVGLDVSPEVLSPFESRRLAALRS